MSTIKSTSGHCAACKVLLLPVAVMRGGPIAPAPGCNNSSRQLAPVTTVTTTLSGGLSSHLSLTINSKLYPTHGLLGGIFGALNIGLAVSAPIKLIGNRGSLTATTRQRNVKELPSRSRDPVPSSVTSAPGFTVWSAPAFALGGLFVTVTVKLHGTEVLPEASVALHVTVVTPPGKVSPERTT